VLSGVVCLIHVGALFPQERPPSPSAPPPDDDDEDALSIRSWSRTSDDGSLLEKRSSRAVSVEGIAVVGNLV